MSSRSLGAELRRGVSETATYALSHHTPQNHHRCYRVGGDDGVRLCARCTGIYLALPLGIATAASGLLGGYHFLVVAVFPLFALLDWSYTAFTDSEGSNPARTASGAFLGFAYGIGLVRMAASFPDVQVLLVGCGYAVAAGLLLAAHRQTGNART